MRAGCSLRQLVNLAFVDDSSWGLRAHLYSVDQVKKQFRDVPTYGDGIVKGAVNTAPLCICLLLHTLAFSRLQFPAHERTVSGGGGQPIPAKPTPNLK